MVGKMGRTIGRSSGKVRRHGTSERDARSMLISSETGTYNYPISFAIAASSPPTIHADFGSVTYRLRATVFRAGALTPNLVEDTEVLVLASPNEDDMEESENIIVERQWEDQMRWAENQSLLSWGFIDAPPSIRYLIALSGKSFPIGGHMWVQLCSSCNIS